MPVSRFSLLFPLAISGLIGCSDDKTVIPTTQLTEEQKQAVKAEDDKVADEESHGAKRR